MSRPAIEIYSDWLIQFGVCAPAELSEKEINEWAHASGKPGWHVNRELWFRPSAIGRRPDGSVIWAESETSPAPCPERITHQHWILSRVPGPPMYPKRVGPEGAPRGKRGERHAASSQ